MNDLLTPVDADETKTQTIEATPEVDTVEATEIEAPTEEQALAVVSDPSPPVVQESPVSTVLSMIAQASGDARVDPAKMRELLALRREVMQEQAAIEARQAFNRVCRNMPRITKRGAIEFGKGQKPIPYAKWEDIADAIKPVYEAENFSLRFDTSPRDGGGLIVTARLEHDNGHVITSEFPVPLDTSGGKQNIQGMGSAGSYGQRYATKNLFNLVFENDPVDDDGKTASNPPINDEAIAQISALVEETGTDPRAFLEWVFGDDAPHHYGEITTTMFPKALNALLAKKRKQAQDKKEAEL